jgi:hypothetical protein
MTVCKLVNNSSNSKKCGIYEYKENEGWGQRYRSPFQSITKPFTSVLSRTPPESESRALRKEDVMKKKKEGKQERTAICQKESEGWKVEREKQKERKK